MTDVAHLGGGYAESAPDSGPTIAALLRAAHSGSPSSRLVVLGGPPGVGKTAVAQALLALCPNTFLLDKDQTAAGFILEAAALRGDAPDAAYGTPHYWQKLRPLEYASALSAACANLVGTRQVLLVGGFGPELGEDVLWEGLAANIAQPPSASSTSIRRPWKFGAPAWPVVAPAPMLPILPISRRPSATFPSGPEPSASQPTAP